jgi:diguanylate cyclase (GGDEF)-like protein
MSGPPLHAIEDLALKLHEIMSTPDPVFASDTPLTTLIAALAERDCNEAYICEQGKPVGRLPATALLRAVTRVLQGGDNTATAETVMIPKPQTATPNLDLQDALALLLASGLECLAVVDSYGLLVGQVSHTHLLTQLLKDSQKNAGQDGSGQATHWLSLEDSLTGLPNRRAMEMDLRHAEAVAKRRNEPFTLALIGVDHLQSLSETLGRPAADAALRHVANVLKEKIRASDKMFRCSGSEFLFLMPCTAADGALIAVERLREAVANAGLANTQSPLGIVTVSIGVASKVGGSWQVVLQQSENALAHAKEQGQNAVSSAR